MQDGIRHLFDDEGNFRFLGKKLGMCALCRDKDYVYKVGAMGPHMTFCRKCILRDGADNLRRDANIALQNSVKRVEQIREGWEELQARYRARFGTDLKLYKNGAPE